jgi:hypothetical protein
MSMYDERIRIHDVIVFSVQTSNRRNNMLSLTRAMNNGSETVTNMNMTAPLPRLTSAGDTLRRTTTNAGRIQSRESLD